MADGNHDRVVDAADYELWRTHLGMAATASAPGQSPVPETASMALLATALLILCGHTSRSR